MSDVSMAFTMSASTPAMSFGIADDTPSMDFGLEAAYTHDHSSLYNLDYASSGHTGFVGSYDAIPDSFIDNL